VRLGADSRRNPRNVAYCETGHLHSADIGSKVGICTFLDTKRNGKSIDAHLECQFPAGPLIGDVTFTLQSDNTVKFVDHDQHYRSVLYRCPQ
jgi:hypothetical protein